MRAMANLFVALLALAIPSGGRAAAPPSGDIRAAIEATNARLAAALAKGDAAQMAALYTSDGQIMPPSSDLAQGREAIQKVWQGAIDAGMRDVTLTSLEVEGHGDLAHEVGTYTLASKDGKAERGKYIVIWKKEKGQWRLHRDIWNTTKPAPAGQAAPAAKPAATPATKPTSR